MVKRNQYFSKHIFDFVGLTNVLRFVEIDRFPIVPRTHLCYFFENARGSQLFWTQENNYSMLAPPRGVTTF